MLPDNTAKKRTSGGIVVTLAIGIVGAVLLFGSTLANAVPSVRWTPGSVYEEINPGVPRTLTVRFVAQDNVPATTVRVVPELQSYVNVAPSTIGALTKGQTIQVTLTLQAGGTVPLFTAKDGVIQLRQQSSPNKTIAQPLSIKLLVVPVGFPPDPGEAGKATIRGIDSNGDGVRDDVERYIDMTVQDSARHREALKSYARVVQGGLLSTTKEQSLVAGDSEMRSIECLSYLGVRKQSRWKEVLALTLNTEARLSAQQANLSRQSGEVYRSLPRDQYRAACMFDVETLPN